MRKPTLKGSRVILRVPKLSDAPVCVRWFNDKKVIRYLSRQDGMTLAEEKKFIRGLEKNKNNIVLAMINEEGKHIGNAGVELSPINRRAHFGILIGEKDQWGKGYAGETINLLADYVFKKLKYNRLDLNVDMTNSQGLRAYEKAGFKLEGVKRKYRYNKITKKYDNEGIMAILREDWLKVKRRLTK